MKAVVLCLLFVAQGAFAQDVKSEVYKMYPTPNAQPNPMCDLHTEMTYWPRETVDVVILENKVSGACEIAVDPDVRTYVMSRKADECGSRVVEDTMAGMRLISHKTRVCDDVVPALMVLEEIDGNGNVVGRLYSKDR